MGQSILRYRRKPFRSGVDSAFGYWLVFGCKTFHRSPHLPKGNRVNIPEPGIGYAVGSRAAANAVTQMNSETLTRALERVVFSS